MDYRNNKCDGYIIDRKEQALISAVASELLSYTKIDYYSDDDTVKIRYFGPKRMTITIKDVKTRIVTTDAR